MSPFFGKTKVKVKKAYVEGNKGCHEFDKIFKEEDVEFSNKGNIKGAWNSVYTAMQKIYKYQQHCFDQSNYPMEQADQSYNLVNLSSNDKDFGKSFTVSSSFLYGDII